MITHIRVRKKSRKQFLVGCKVMARHLLHDFWKTFEGIVCGKLQVHDYRYRCLLLVGNP